MIFNGVALVGMSFLLAVIIYIIFGEDDIDGLR